jgi:DNA-binding transcriptional regulator YiaG
VDLAAALEHSREARMNTTNITRKVAGRTFSVEVPAVEHAEHGHGVLAPDLQRAEVAIAATLALEGPVHAESFRFMRGALGIAAKDLAELLGVTPETVSRWENGAGEVNRSAWLTLGTIALERAGRPTMTQERMAKIAEGKKPPKERRVDL